MVCVYFCLVVAEFAFKTLSSFHNLIAIVWCFLLCCPNVGQNTKHLSQRTQYESLYVFVVCLNVITHMDSDLIVCSTRCTTV